MATVNDTIDIEAPISAVYALWTRFEDFPKFMSGVESITQKNDTDLFWKVNIGGVEREFDAKITEQNQDERIAWASTDGKTQAGVVTFHRLEENKTRVALQLDWEPEGLLEKVGAALQVDDLQIKGDLKRFKELAERTPADNAAESGWDGNVDRATDATGR